MNGVICLDNDIECVEYGVDLTTYALDWATAIMTGDVVGIFNQVLGDHPDFDFPECTNWWVLLRHRIDWDAADMDKT